MLIITMPETRKVPRITATAIVPPFPSLGAGVLVDVTEVVVVEMLALLIDVVVVMEDVPVVEVAETAEIVLLEPEAVVIESRSMSEISEASIEVTDLSAHPWLTHSTSKHARKIMDFISAG